MSGGQPPRDWDKELAQIDKLIATGGAGAGAQVPAAAGAAAAAGSARLARARRARRRARRRGVFFTWLRLLLGLALGVAITQWPYVRGCGIPLFGYLVAVAGVIVAGLWSAVSSWRSRSAFAHVPVHRPVLLGRVLAAREILPRIGYARTTATWFCPVGGGSGAGGRHPPPHHDLREPSDHGEDVQELHRRRVGGPLDRGVHGEPQSRRLARPDRPLPQVGAPGRGARGALGARGFETVARVPAPQRADVLRRVGRSSWCARKEEIARAMTREMGKVLTETRGDVQEGIDTAYYAAGEGRRLFGHTVPSELRDKWAMTHAPPDRRRGDHHPLQLPDGDPDLEDLPGAALRERRGLQARQRRPAHRHAVRRGPARGRRARPR